MAQDAGDSRQAGGGGWSRAPSRREHRLGGWMFLGFAVFFAAAFLVLSDSRMRWVMLTLGVCSAVRGTYHLVRAALATEQP